MLRFTDEHEWVKVDGQVATVGITTFAASQLGDLVFIDLPKVGVKLKKGGPAAIVESVKAASDVYAPLAGEVTEVNAAAVTDPTVVGSDPQGDGWLYKIQLDDASSTDGLMDEAAYAKLTG